MGEGHDDLFLLVADGEKVAPQIPQSRARIDDGDAVGVGECNLQTGGFTAELLETRIANGDRAACAVKFELHEIGLLESVGAVMLLDEAPGGVGGRGTGSVS